MSTKILLSIIICSHNPKRIYLDRVLNALKSQALSKENWEVLLIDNKSSQPLALEFDLSWHPNARHIREETLGLTPARLRGIQESRAELLVFVDDDNILFSDYLENALKISKEYTSIGAWGGQTIPEFEETPPEWTKPYWWMLAIYQFERSHWSNIPYSDTNPCGAGLCIRRFVAEKYALLVLNDQRRAGLDRKGNLLTSCGDTDLVFTAYDIGLGTGKFVDLKLTHLMPSNRLEEDYLLKLAEGNGYSSLIFDSLRNPAVSVSSMSWTGKLFEWYQLQKMSPVGRRLYQAKKRGEQLALKAILAKK